MWCVMHAEDGNEIQTERFVGGLLGDGSGGRCFHLTRLRNKKYGGKWRTVRDGILPGYVSAVADEPGVYQGQGKIPGYGLPGTAEAMPLPLGTGKRALWRRYQEGEAWQGRSPFPG